MISVSLPGWFCLVSHRHAFEILLISLYRLYYFSQIKRGKQLRDGSVFCKVGAGGGGWWDLRGHATKYCENGTKLVL